MFSRTVVTDLNEILRPYGITMTLYPPKGRTARKFFVHDRYINPSAIESDLPEPPAQILVFQQPIMGNVFFAHTRRVTLCTVSDWSHYSPPSERCLLLYVALRHLLRLKYETHHADVSKLCILQPHLEKGDTRAMLSALAFPGEQRPLKKLFCPTCTRILDSGEQLLRVLSD